MLGVKQHDRSPQALGIALCRGQIRIIPLNSMCQPTIRIDSQTENVDHALAHARQVLANEIFLMHGLKGVPDIHNPIDQHQQFHVRCPCGDLESDAAVQLPVGVAAGVHAVSQPVGGVVTSWPAASK